MQVCRQAPLRFLRFVPVNRPSDGYKTKRTRRSDTAPTRVLYYRDRDMKQNKLRVFLVDDHPTVRAGVRLCLTSHGLAVVGEASDAPEALRKIKKLAPDVIVLDVNLPSMNGWELALRLHRLVPKSKILAFSIHSSEEYVVRMAQAGARGYVVKDQPTAELLKAIKQVARGGLHFPGGMSDALVSPTVDAPNASRKGINKNQVFIQKQPQRGKLAKRSIGEQGAQ